MKYVLNNSNLEVNGKQYLKGVGGYNGTNPTSSQDLATVINNISSGGSGGSGSNNFLINITHGELVTLRDSELLIPGAQYRITDYFATTTQNNTKSANNQFDIIVTADDVNVLNHLARAAKHEGDGDYFDSCDIEAWQLWYNIDNDTTKYEWADDKNGKGVIYRMIDDKGNDCPYDFKNILFYTDKYTDNTTSDNYYYTFSYIVNNVLYDGTVESQVKNCYNNSMKGVLSQQPQSLNGNIFRNIGFNDGCHTNTFNDNCSDNIFGYYCYDNTFGDGCFSNIFRGSVYSNTFGDGCGSNTFGEECGLNTFGADCQRNTFGEEYCGNTFGSECFDNSFGNSCFDNTFGNSCSSNTFGDNCRNNNFGNSCSSNTFGESCLRNTFGHGCYSNTLGDGCQENTFGDGCYENTFGNTYCRNNIGHLCYHIDFLKQVNLYRPYWTTMDRVLMVNVGNMCSNLSIKCFLQADDMIFKNYVIGANLSGEIEIIEDVNMAYDREYETKIMRNSKGEIKQYCEADLLDMTYNPNVSATVEDDKIVFGSGVTVTDNTMVINNAQVDGNKLIIN